MVRIHRVMCIIFSVSIFFLQFEDEIKDFVKDDIPKVHYFIRLKENFFIILSHVIILYLTDFLVLFTFLNKQAYLPSSNRSQHLRR